LPDHKKMLATGVVSHREELIKIREGTALSVRSLVNPGPMTCGLAVIQTNKHASHKNNKAKGRPALHKVKNVSTKNIFFSDSHIQCQRKSTWPLLT
jgi:hypothetical protein